MAERKKRFSLDRFKKTFITSKKIVGLYWSIDKKLFIANAVVVIIPAILPFVNAYLYKLIIDFLIQSFSTNNIQTQQLVILLGLRLMTLLIQDFSFSIQTYVEQLLYYKIPAHIYQLVLGKLASLDVSYFEDSNFRDRLEKVRDAYTWRPLNMITFLSYGLQNVVQILIAFVAIATLNWIFIFIIILLAIPSFVAQTTYANINWGIWHQNSPNRKRFYYIAELIQAGQSIKEIKLFQMGSKLLKELKNLYSEFTKENIGTGRKQLKTNLGIGVFGTVVYTVIEIYIIFSAFKRRISIGDIGYFTAVVTNFQNGIGGFFRNMAQVFSASLYVQEIFDLLAIETNIKESPKMVKVDLSKSPAIEFKNVSFVYPGTTEKIFSNFSLTIHPGEKIALVGENGAGKTTLIKLLARFYDVTEGEIIISGNNIKELELASWYKALGVLFQDFVRYEYSFEDNIYFGKIYEEKDENKIKQAAKISGASGIAEELKDGYKQMLGKTFENGAELSVGQWQKVALARAFLRDAPVLILDEPTASIDAKAEAEIFEKVERLSKNKTVIIISHRFSTVRNADKIYVIHKGKIKEEGSHEKLMKTDGIYASLFKLQAKGYQ